MAENLRSFLALCLAYLAPYMALGQPLKLDLEKAPLLQSIESLKGREGRYTPFWICSDSDSAQVKARCVDLGTNELEGAKSELQIILTGANLRHEFGQSHGIATKECRRLRTAIYHSIKKQSPFCFRGNFIKMSRSSLNQSHVDWVFLELLTYSGSVCEFQDCEKL